MLLDYQKPKGKTYRYIFFFSFSDFDLEKEKSVLDEQGLQIAENQENSQKNKRKLAESTRGMHAFPTMSKLWQKDSYKGYIVNPTYKHVSIKIWNHVVIIAALSFSVLSTSLVFIISIFTNLLFGLLNMPERSQFMLYTDFKKASPEDKLSLFNTLLKGYQEEVDNLTKRAKFGENTFLNIYQKLYEAPDPYPALASIAVSSSITSMTF